MNRYKYAHANPNILIKYLIANSNLYPCQFSPLYQNRLRATSFFPASPESVFSFSLKSESWRASVKRPSIFYYLSHLTRTFTLWDMFEQNNSKFKVNSFIMATSKLIDWNFLCESLCNFRFKSFPQSEFQYFARIAICRHAAASFWQISSSNFRQQILWL